jgi:hypothetical protein
VNVSGGYGFEHRGDARVFRDVRHNPGSTVLWDHCYFVGFRVATADGEHYRHALLIADSHDAFVTGLSQEYLAMVDHVAVRSKRDISLVFMHNLMSRESGLMDAAGPYQVAVDHARPIVRSGNGRFAVVGLSESLRLCVLEVETDNALQAIDDANVLVLEQLDERFKPVLVCQAHPVTLEFYALLEQAVERFRHLVGVVSAGTRAVH